MDGIHNSLTRVFFLNKTAPRTSGGTFNLGKGQVGLFSQKSSAQGAVAISSLVNTKGEKFFIEVGTGFAGNQGGLTTKGMRTALFAPKDVLEVTYSAALAPTSPSVILGYDGVDANKSIKLVAGAASNISIQLKGEYLGYLGFSNNETTQNFTIIPDDLADCADDCLATGCVKSTLEVINEIKNRRLRYGVTLGDVLNVSLISPCFTDADAVAEKTYWSLTLQDDGSSNALGLVQAQYTYPVERIERTGVTSVYQIIVPTTASDPSAYIVYADNIKTDCGASCPSGYTATGGGFLYSLSLPTAAGIAAALAGKSYIETAVKVGQEYNIDKYAIVCAAELTSANIADLISTYGGLKLDTDYVVVESVCVKDSNATVAWVEGDSCEVASKEYFIDVNDDNCGNSMLAQLNAAYPDLDVYIKGAITTVTTPVSGSFTTGTYSGVSGTTDGTGTGATFNVVVTGNNSAAITVVTAGTGYKVGDVITILDADLGNGGEDDLEIVVATVTNLNDSGCRQRYFTTVTSSNLVCEECHTNQYEFEAPDSFGQEEWFPASALVAYDEDCLCGIKFTPKNAKFCPPKELYGELTTVNGQIEINVSGGESYGGNQIGQPKNSQGAWAVTRIGRAFDGSGWGDEYCTLERFSYSRELGIKVSGSYAENYLRGSETVLDPCGQYDAFTLRIKGSKLANSFGQTLNEDYRYVFVVPTESAHLFKTFFNTVAAGNPEIESI